MKYEIWFMDEDNNIVGEEHLDAIGLMHAMALITTRSIPIPDNAVTLSMEIKP